MRGYRRSRMERFIAATVTLISLALLILVSFDIFRSTRPFASDSRSEQVFALARPNALMSSTMISDQSASPARIEAVQPTNPNRRENRALGVEPQDELPAELAAARQELDDTRLALDAALQENAELQSRLKRTEAQLDITSQELREQVAALNNRLEAEIAAKSQISATVTETNRQLAGLRQRNAALSERVQAFEARDAAELAAIEAVPQAHAQAQSAYLAGNFDEAAEIWRSLAENNDPRALFHLGSMAFEGRLEGGDLLLADSFLTRSIEGGFGPALAMRERVRGAMTAEERARVPSL